MGNIIQEKFLFFKNQIKHWDRFDFPVFAFAVFSLFEHFPKEAEHGVLVVGDGSDQEQLGS